MKEINSDEYRIVTSTTTNTLTINEINALGYTQYTTGGVVEYNDPVTLTGYTARMQIRPTIESETVISTLTTENGGINIDTEFNTISILINATETANYEFQTAVYSLELIKNQEVITFCKGNISLVKEVTR